MPQIVIRRHMLCALSILCGLLQAGPATSQTVPDFYVNSVADKVDKTPGDGKCDTGAFVDGTTPECTLRAAIDEVNAKAAQNPGHLYTVSVAAGTYLLTTSETCKYKPYGGYQQATATITLCISASLTLTGVDPMTTVIDAGLAVQEFYISENAVVSMSNLTLQHGSNFNGGSIENDGFLTLINDIFSQNRGTGSGGAVYNVSKLVVVGSTFLANGNIPANNPANYSGAAIESDGTTATASIDSSYFTQNNGGQGVAIATYEGTLNVTNSTFSGNIAAGDGVIGLYGGTIASIANSTISDNSIGNTGAIDTPSGSVTLNNDTIVGNAAGNGSGGVIGAAMTISNTILSSNTDGDCLVDSVTDLGHNIVQNVTSQCVLGSTTLTGADPQLGPLQIDEGVLPTMSPLANSPALGAGSSAIPGSNMSGACTALDERGIVRGVGAACSIGAAEALGGLHVTRVIPNRYGSGGSATVVVIHGSGFVQGSTAVLRSGAATLTPAQTTVSSDGYSMSLVLNLSSATAAVYDVVVTTPSKASATLPASFTVGAAGPPNTYSYVFGPTVARPGRPAIFSIAYGNRADVDAFLVPFSLSLPGSFTNLILGQVVSPPTTTGTVITDWSQVPVQVNPTAGYVNVPLVIPVIPAGTQGVMQISLTPPATVAENATFSFNASIGKAYGTSPNGSVDAAALSQFVAGAQKYAQKHYALTLTAAEQAQLGTFATTQLAQMVTGGQQALAASAGGKSIFYSLPRMIIGMANYFRPISHGGGGGSGGGGGGGGGAGGGGGGGLTPPTPAPSPPGPDDPDDCGDEPGWTLDGSGECPPPPPSPDSCSYDPDVDCGPFPEPFSIDPNEINGPLGIGAAHFTLALDPFQYQAEFENSATATAAAQTVVVSETINPQQYDLATFQLGPVSFGPYSLSPPEGLSSWSTSLDLRPTENVIVLIKASLNATTAVATWSFTSLDPGTLKLVTDPTAGFLPPDITPPAGIGRVAYSVKPLASVTSGARLCATASIVFDTNAPLVTAPYCNTKDTMPPVSAVKALPATEATPAFTVTWSGTDAGVGVANYTVYVSTDAGTFAPFVSNTTLTSSPFTGALGHYYRFYSIATDRLGNVEAAKINAEASTSTGGGSAPLAASTTALAVSPAGSIPDGAAVTLAATVSGASRTAPTGTVQFAAGTMLLGAAPVSLNATGVATLTVTTLPVGTDTITAAYSGDAHYVGSTAQGAVTVAAAPTPSFTLGLSAPSVSLTGAASATETLIVTPMNGFKEVVTFACSGLPANTTCSFSPATVRPGGSAPVTAALTIARDVATAAFGAPAPSTPEDPRSLVALLVTGPALTGCRRRKASRARRALAMLALVGVSVIVLGSALTGCGSSDSPAPVTTPTPVSTAVTVTATAGGVVQQTIFTLVIN
jgi:CSLREA domain-containing protein